MLRKWQVIAPLLATVGACNHDTDVQTVVPRADYDVYVATIDSLLIRAWGSRELIIISPTVRDGPEQEEHIEAVIDDANLPEDVRANFIANNRLMFTLHPEDFALDTPFTILSMDSALAREVPGDQGRAPLPSAFPSGRDLVELSRVGFSRDSSRAVVYLGHTCGGLCGTGWKVQLRRDAGRGWHVVSAETLWIS